MQTITELLKAKNGARLSLGNSWLVWDEASEEWAIYRQKYGERVKLYALVSTEEWAVGRLIEANET